MRTSLLHAASREGRQRVFGRRSPGSSPWWWCGGSLWLGVSGSVSGCVWMAVLELVGGLALFEGVQAEVAAVLSPLVGLLGQDGADQADDGVPVGEDAH